MNSMERNYLKRLTAFFNKEWEKGEMNEYEQIKEELANELKKGVGF